MLIMCRIRIHNNENGYEVFRGDTYIGRRKTLKAAENLCNLVRNNEDDFESWYKEYRKKHIKTECKNKTHIRIQTGISISYFNRHAQPIYRVKIKHCGISYELGYYESLEDAKIVRSEAEKFRSLGLFIPFYTMNKSLFTNRKTDRDISLMISPLC